MRRYSNQFKLIGSRPTSRLSSEETRKSLLFKLLGSRAIPIQAEGGRHVPVWTDGLRHRCRCNLHLTFGTSHRGRLDSNGGEQEDRCSPLRRGAQQEGFRGSVEISGAAYIQQNPTAKDGPEGLKGFIGFLRDRFPNSKSEIKRIFADGDYVIVHVHAVREPCTRGLAIMDIFKLENGKVVEHWDVVQPIPETVQDDNGMF